eukprot:TRINITY_DN40777_c0_g1_i1.p1 TRINITY_DN40777_c0_g1~~TRINITY_DN40777_c0_g1_i1.p1  ORF type:complete len:805 (+),score=94.80 TRINITY_DN40777_c0_g1_i1:142-2415(+)
MVATSHTGSANEEDKILDWNTRAGSCGIPVPRAFTCRDLPEWSGFLTRFQKNAEAGYPSDLALYKEASDLIERPRGLEHPPEGFYKYLCGGPEATWPLPDGFCLMGFIGALFIRARHHIFAAHAAIAGNSGDTDVAAHQEAADSDLLYVEPLLGKEFSLDFLDSSPWPVSILDVFLNINQTDFMTYSQYVAQNPVRQPAVSLESLHWQKDLRHGQEKQVAGVEVGTAVFGTHAALSQEPVDMLGRVAKIAGIDGLTFRATFFGLEQRWCQVRGLCASGGLPLTELLRAAEQDPFSFPWNTMAERITEAYDSEDALRTADLLVCTEPVASCLMLRQAAASRGRKLPVLGYFGVALLNGCPPQDLDFFWQEFEELFGSSAEAVLAVNNLILSEQVFYQTGKRVPYVRAHGLHTGVTYAPQLENQILFWRSPLFPYPTIACALGLFLEGSLEYPMRFRFLLETDSLQYEKAMTYRAIGLLPHDHALMSFYELYSAGVPLMLPNADWMYRLLYMRGQLSVGERWYQSVMPDHEPPHCEFAEPTRLETNEGHPDPAWGMTAAKAARGAAEQVLKRAVQAQDLQTVMQMAKAAQELMQDMKFFLAVAENRTDLDSATSMGFVRRFHQSASRDANSRPATTRVSPPHTEATSVRPAVSAEPSRPWHPYTPFQMSTQDSNDWTRMRKGGWWLRRGARFDAMRYWFQFSDFARFPGLVTFANLPDLLCKAPNLDIVAMTTAMREFNSATLSHSLAFWSDASAQLLR